MNTDNLIKWAMAVTVSMVTGIAAYVSFTHIYAVSHNPLLAFSIDGMIVTSTLVLMTANRSKLGTMGFAYAGQWLGIGATIFANIAYGYPHGLESAAWSVWPAVCFVVSVETIAQLSRRKRKRKPAVVVKPERPLGDILVEGEARRRVKHDTEMAKILEPVYGPPPLAAKDTIPGILKIRKECHVGPDKAKRIQEVMRLDLTDMKTAHEKVEKERANG